jgi:hypothetical protein
VADPDVAAHVSLPPCLLSQARLSQRHTA